jgi:hypothetical protein
MTETVLRGCEFAADVRFETEAGREISNGPSSGLCQERK